MTTEKSLLLNNFDMNVTIYTFQEGVRRFLFVMMVVAPSWKGMFHF